MLCIVGLGNPGKEYSETRHNIGFKILDQIAVKLNLDFSEDKKFKSLISQKFKTEGEEILLVKPQTFMNLSGEAISAIKSFYKIPSQNFIVIYDELDLPLGKIKIRPSGGPGTHNGLKSCVQHLTNNFPRIRVGIESRGKTAPAQIDTHNFVLGKFTKEDETLISDSIKNATNAILELVNSPNLEVGLQTIMNKFNK